MINDFDKLDGFGTELFEADLCIIGGGIAGLIIAKEFISSNLNVLILEGGGRTLEPESQALYRAHVVGQAHPGHMEGRFRVYGGNSTKWGGQMLPLSRSDIESRQHVVNSGWPISFETLSSYYERALEIMRVNQLPFDSEIWPVLGVHPYQFNSAIFRYRYSKWARFRDRNLARTIGPEVERADNIEVLLHASVTHIQLVANGDAVDSVKISSLSGKEAKVKAKHYILCNGTLESARTLLASNDVMPEGIGNQRGLVGRYFQDHISFRAADLYPADNKQFTESFSSSFVRKILHFPRIEMCAEAQAKYNCLSAFAHVQFEPAEDSGFIAIRDALLRMQARKGIIAAPTDLKRMLRDIPYLTRIGLSHFLGGRVPYPPRCQQYLLIDIEQAPNPDSRVYLSDEKDALGMPILTIDWRPGEKERLTAMRFLELFQAEWQSLNIGEADWNTSIQEPGDAWLASSSDSYHQVGTARMADSPHDGVVNADLRVHGIDNLHIGSCAVFPCSGSANPTYSMMALCLRLADHLRSTAFTKG